VKKAAIVILAMTLLMVLFAVPVMATPKDSSPAWHTYPVTDTYYEVTYAQLTQMCLDAGLSANPYPAPTTPTEDDTQFPIIHVYGISEYYEFTFTIGDEDYPGISCVIYDLTLNVFTGEGQLVYTKAPHYLGEIGKMNHGFDGLVTADFSNAGFTATFVLQGFGRFTGQTIIETQDSRVSMNVATGYCLMLGNKWYK